MVLVAGCNRPSDTPQLAGGDTSSGRPQIYVVNYPLAYLAQRLAGETADVHFLVAPGKDPAYWTPSPEEVRRFQAADIILINGADYAKWVAHMTLPEERIINTSAEAEQRYITLPDAVVHKHGPEGEHAHEGYVSETWLDPRMLDVQADAIYEALVDRWPQHQEMYKRNRDELASDIHELRARLDAIKQLRPNLNILTSHPVYHYFADYMQWPLESVHWEPGEAPSDEQWKAFAELHARHPARVMLWEGEPDEATRQRLTDEFQVQPVVFETLGNRPTSGGDYFSAMHENIARLEAVLMPAKE